jgi:hypothetical protein
MSEPQYFAKIITGDVVRKWYGARPRNPPTAAQCDAIAAELRKFRSAAERRSRQAETVDHIGDPYWNFRQALDATKCLIEMMPRQIRHWESVHKWPETAHGLEVMTRLSNALDEALPYIEWPFGRYEGKRQPRRRIVAWHVAAVLVAGSILRATGQSGAGAKLDRTSILPKVVVAALAKLEYGGVEAGAVSMCLKRWRRDFGLPGT